MIDVKLLVPAIISIIIIFIVIHFVVAIVFPRLKTAFLGLTKNEKAANALVALLFFVLSVYGANAIIPLIEGIQNPILNYVSIFTPSVEILMSFVPVVQWILVGVVVALGLQKK